MTLKLRGLAKLGEESTEVAQQVFKLLQLKNEPKSFVDINVLQNLKDEIADLEAILQYVKFQNPSIFDTTYKERIDKKIHRFQSYDSLCFRCENCNLTEDYGFKSCIMNLVTGNNDLPTKKCHHFECDPDRYPEHSEFDDNDVDIILNAKPQLIIEDQRPTAFDILGTDDTNIDHRDFIGGSTDN